MICGAGAKGERRRLWTQMDYNGAGAVSLAEVDALLVREFPLLDDASALMAAFEYTIQSQPALSVPDGNDARQQSAGMDLLQCDLAVLLRAAYFFNRLWLVV